MANSLPSERPHVLVPIIHIYSLTGAFWKLHRPMREPFLMPFGLHSKSHKLDGCYIHLSVKLAQLVGILQGDWQREDQKVDSLMGSSTHSAEQCNPSCLGCKVKLWGENKAAKVATISSLLGFSLSEPPWKENEERGSAWVCTAGRQQVESKLILKKRGTALWR